MLARPIKPAPGATHARAGRERPFEPEPALFELASLGPEPEQRACELDARFDEGPRSQGPVECRPDVLLLDPQSPEQRQLPVAAEIGRAARNS